MADKIEIGEYVRTYEGIIGKFLYDNGSNFVYEVNGESIEDSTGIAKHNKDINELIENGDILEIYFPIRQITKKVCVDKYFKDSFTLKAIIQKIIILKSIVTHEQFENNSYKIGV